MHTIVRICEYRANHLTVITFQVMVQLQGLCAVTEPLYKAFFQVDWQHHSPSLSFSWVMILTTSGRLCVFR